MAAAGLSRWPEGSSSATCLILARDDRLSAYLIHELAHGYHALHLPDGLSNEAIEDAYNRQLPLMLYYNLTDSDGDYDDEGHANSNAIEYFAHLSNKYLGTAGEYPFVSAELRRHDPWGWHVADAVWTWGRLDSFRLSCDRLGDDDVRSEFGSNRIRLDFLNATEDVRYVRWIDQDGEVRQGYEWETQPEETQRINSRRTHLWAVLDENKECLELFVPGLESEELELTK